MNQATHDTRGTEPPSLRFGRFFPVFAAGLVLLSLSWMSDDAYITLRTVDNVVHGHGATWNTAERVQAYTHPLWFLLLTVFYSFTRESYFTTLAVSFLCTIAVLSLFCSALRARSGPAAAGLVVLLLSGAFRDYSSSGLENPLTHLLLMTALSVLFTPSPLDTRARFFRLCLIAGLAGVNRLDTLLFYIPLLVATGAGLRMKARLPGVLAFFLPLAAWESFSLLYYGFPFPNTAYAKLCTGIDRLSLLGQGLAYFKRLLFWDPLTFTVIAAGLFRSMKRGSRHGRAMAAGVILYLSYVLGIGGDFMSGRFFSGAFLVSLFLLIDSLSPLRFSIRRTALLSVSMLGFVSVAVSFHRPADTIGSDGIVDERRYYFREMGLIHQRPGQPAPRHRWRTEGLAMKADPALIRIRKTIGLCGFFAGPDVHIVDELALADPLLARLPMADKINWRIGHFIRPLPDGYMLSLQDGANNLRDPDLRRYYEKLMLVVRGDLWEFERLATIVRMNLGGYDGLLKRHRDRQRSAASSPRIPEP